MKDTIKTTQPKIYLALGDSMSIDFYTGQAGGGAVAQLLRRLQGLAGRLDAWRLDDRTVDGQTMAGVGGNFHRADRDADLVTMTIGGNDLLQHVGCDPEEFLPEFGRDYARLTLGIRQAHPRAVVIVANIYRPAGLSRALCGPLDEANRLIGFWAGERGFRLADVFGAFLGHEDEYLCRAIEPTLRGAAAIAGLFEAQYRAAVEGQSQTDDRDEKGRSHAQTRA